MHEPERDTGVISDVPECHARPTLCDQLTGRGEQRLDHFGAAPRLCLPHRAILRCWSMANRVAPAITACTEPFWTGGAEGILRIQRCRSCRAWLHPPRVRCPRCFGVELAFDPVSGRGSVWSFTLNRLGQGDPDVDPPIIAEVELAEQPGLLLLTNLVTAAIGEVHIGMQVHVEFEPGGDAWVPVRAVKAESSTVLSGVGVSQVGRRLGHDPIELTFEASANAIADAGLEPGDIDRLATYPGASGSTPGISGAGIDDVRSMFGLRTRWRAGGAEISGQLGAVVNALLAVGAGLCERVLCSARCGSRRRRRKSETELAWWPLDTLRSAVVATFGVGYATFGGLAMQRYMHESGATREQFAQLAVVSRANASGNPLAVYRDPLTVDDYLGARMISDPLCLYDCDVPVDGAVGVIVSRSTHPMVDRNEQLESRR